MFPTYTSPYPWGRGTWAPTNTEMKILEAPTNDNKKITSINIANETKSGMTSKVFYQKFICVNYNLINYLHKKHDSIDEGDQWLGRQIAFILVIIYTILPPFAMSFFLHEITVNAGPTINQSLFAQL